MGKIYRGDVGTEILINMQTDLTSATGIVLVVKKPDDTVVNWIPTVQNDEYLKYTVVSGDLNLKGDYTIQANLTIGSWTGSSTICNFSVDPIVSD